MTYRVKITIRGAVQGVGFRPFIYRLATELNIKGNVMNTSSGVYIDAESIKATLELFIRKITDNKPAISFISSLEYFYLDPINYKSFEIIESNEVSDISAIILPDITVCHDCLKEMYDPSDRRYLYPFINCTNCGPRFSIIKAIPYDRKNTTMIGFEMCDNCREEYENPADRRYHAQPIACPDCGPQIELWDRTGKTINSYHEAILLCSEKIKNGEIIALKGIGGFQLLVDARNEAAIKKLRERKHRVDKPFAVMFPDIDLVKKVCNVSSEEERLLQSPESPIVILKRKDNSDVFCHSSVAPANPTLGVMLPYSPLHSLLMNELKIPVIATSANISEEPMCIDEYEALERLNGITDYYLVHNRPILRHVDDSVVRVINGRVMVNRRARGYAPLPVEMSGMESDKVMLAVGGHLKNTVSLKVGNNVFISQHIGDLETQEANKAFQRIIGDFKKLYKVEPELIITDQHPDYYSTNYAKTLNLPTKSVQHHVAHVASCRAENQVTGTALGIAWDGTGFGDGEIWGGEFFITAHKSCIHTGSFRQFRLPGGDSAVREPRRSAFGLLYEIYGSSVLENDLISKNFSKNESNILLKMLENKLNCPLTSSVGRIFDAVASILDLNQKMNYEGQAAMMLEFACTSDEDGFYDFNTKGNKFLIVDWQPMIEEIIEDKKNSVPVSIISAKFHHTLTEIILNIAKTIGIEKIVISGGCFQNVYLLGRTIEKLEQNNFIVYSHQRIPTNDGGISLGQIAAAEWEFSSLKEDEM